MRQIEIVFVEFGRFPKYTALNIIRLRNLFPEIPVTVLTDVPEKAWSIAGSCEVVEWSTDSYISLQKLRNFQESGDKFWLHTTSRLFAFCEYHLAQRKDSLLHVESDVLLASNFPFKAFLESERLLWGRYNEERDVASLLHSPSQELADLLLEELKIEFDKNTEHTDMSLLSTVAKKLGDHHAYLPSFPSQTSVMVNHKSKINPREVEADSKLCEKFGGIFDHQVIGMWLDGLDPRHRFGLRKNLFSSPVESGESFVDPTGIKYSISNPFRIAVEDGVQTSNLYSIHLHSKSLKWFNLSTIDHIATLLNYANNKMTHRKLDIGITLNLIKQNLLNQTLLSWIRHGLSAVFGSIRERIGRK